MSNVEEMRKIMESVNENYKNAKEEADAIEKKFVEILAAHGGYEGAGELGQLHDLFHSYGEAMYEKCRDDMEHEQSMKGRYDYGGRAR